MVAIRRSKLMLGFVLAAAWPVALASQSPRIAPPPPCRADGRVTVTDLAQRRVPNGTYVAVLPLESRLTTGSQIHLPWALTTGIAERVGELPGVTTPSRGTTERASADAAGRFAEFAQILGAKVIVAGFIGSDRTGATIAIRISEPGAEVPRWEREFAYPTTSLASLENQVATAVAEILGIPRPAEAPRFVADDAAYDDLKRGDYFLAQHDDWAADSARVAFERALGRVPGSAEVIARLARAYAVSLERRGRAGPLGLGPATREANALVDKALQTDSNQVDAWTARAILERVNNPGSYGAALRAHERAVRGAPRSAQAHHDYAVTLLLVGRDAAAAAQLRQALAIEGDRASSLRLLGEIEYLDRRYSNACALVNASIGADSYDPLAYALRARIRMRLDEFRDAFSDAETARRLSDAAWGETLEFYVTAFAREFDAARADARRLSGTKLRSGVTLDVHEAAYLAMGLSAVGSREKAFDALARARPRGAELRRALRDPGFDALRRDPRFGQLSRDEPPRPGAAARQASGVR
jgi:tetratricopeptide (TPR) repeat protein